ncbi:GAF domain-containing SpoIIE family protein phosphatase [Microscilla marina]|uniref:Serine/threonine protein kinases, putative n=1 Tax=Microscilla marina ATCC 23134 TaxID=313606 RepID=A1ZUI0_MICM2|nr:PAS domain S-box protein [Microscilla marina]EAY25999.1 serine/threonine protein kinases, putative [Microscilla marina ATCC 23134]
MDKHEKPVQANGSTQNALPSNGEHAQINEVSDVIKTDPKPTRHFTQRYRFALAITALVFFTSYLLISYELRDQSKYTQQINDVGKQRLLSEQIAKTALLIQHCNSARDCKDKVELFQKMLKVWKVRQAELHYGDSTQGAMVQNSDSIRAMYQQTDKYYQPLRHACDRLDALILKKRINRLLIKRAVQFILLNEDDYIRQMDAIANQYDQEAKTSIRRLHNIQIGLLLIAFLTLILQEFQIFQPVVRRLQLYLDGIQKATSQSQQKNQELEQAYDSLKEEEERARQNSEVLTEINNNLLRTQMELTSAHDELKLKNRELEEASEIISLNEKLETARFFDNSVSHFSAVMNWKNNQDLYSWSDHLLTHLVPFVNGLQAVIYAFDEEQQRLLATGGHAVSKDFYDVRQQLELGETMVGQVAKSREAIYVQNIESSHFETLSGTSEIYPKNIFILPLIYNEVLCGVLELTSIEAFEERHLEVLRRLSETIGANLNALRSQTQINHLLLESQKAQKELENSLLTIQQTEERFRKLAEVTQEGLLFLNEENLDVKDANPVLSRMLGYNKVSDLQGKNYLMFIAPEYRVEIEQVSIIDKRAVHETMALRKDGDTFPIELQARRVTYNEDTMVVLSVRDITERKKTEKELEEANRIASLVKELEKKNKDITASIEYAQRIQEAILPSSDMLKGFLQHFVLYHPKDIVSGDFYWMTEKNEHTFVAAVDCTGHGVPGAFMSLIGYSQLNKIIIEQGAVRPDEILTKLDAGVSEALRQQEGKSKSRDGMDLGLIALNIYEKKLSFAGAYRPMYLVRRGELLEYKGNSFSIGGNFKSKKKKKQFTQIDIELQNGDTIYIASDGYADQFGGPHNRKYMTKNFKRFLLTIQQFDLERQKEMLYHELRQWQGDHRQMDDILVIGLRF